MKILAVVNGTLFRPTEGGAKWTRQLIEQWSVKNDVSVINRGFVSDPIRGTKTTFINFDPRYLSYLKFITTALKNIKENKQNFNRIIYIPLTTLGWWQFFIIAMLSFHSKKQIKVVIFQATSISVLFKLFRLDTLYLVASHWSKKNFEKVGLEAEVLEPFIPKVEKNITRKISDKINIFYLGKLSAKRGSAILKKVAREFKQGSFTVVAPTDSSNVETPNKIPKNITIFKNYISEKEMNQIYVNSDIFLFLPNSALAFIDLPLSIIKAKSYNLKIISSDLPQLRELLRDYKKVDFIKIEETSKMTEKTINILISYEKSRSY